MKKQSYTNINNVTYQDVINCENLLQINKWFDAFCAAEKKANSRRCSNEEMQRIKVFKKALGMKFHTLQLLRLIDLKKKASWPYSTPQYAFFKTAKEMLDEKTYNEVLGRCEFTKLEKNYAPIEVDCSEVIFFESLNISTVDIMNTTDVKLLTKWSIHFRFAFHQFMMDNDTEDKESIRLINLMHKFGGILRYRLHALKNEMKEKAGMTELDTNEKFFCYANHRFCSEAEAYLPCDVFEEIYSASEAYLKEIKNSKFKTASRKMAV